MRHGISTMNPDGRHGFYDLDESWYRYMKADREEKREMCEDALVVEGVVCFFGFIGIVGFLIVALCKGWI